MIIFKRIILSLAIAIGIFLFLSPNHRSFLINYLYNFKSVGAIAPSSQGLALEITRNLPQEDTGYVLELGAGSGVFTKKLAKKTKRENLFIVENNDRLFTLLKKEFKELNLYPYSAENLHNFLPPKIQGKVNYIISGLPLRSLSQPIKQNIFRSIKKVLSTDGTIIQFTYFNSPPITDKECEMYHLEKGILSGKVILNLPPLMCGYIKIKHRIII